MRGIFLLLKSANKQNIVLRKLGMHDTINKIHLIIDSAEALIPVALPRNQYPFTRPIDSELVFIFRHVDYSTYDLLYVHLDPCRYSYNH